MGASDLPVGRIYKWSDHITQLCICAPALIVGLCPSFLSPSSTAQEGQVVTVPGPVASFVWAAVGQRTEIRREKTWAVKSGRLGFKLQLCHSFRKNHPDFRMGMGTRRFKDGDGDKEVQVRMVWPQPASE